MRIPPPEPAQVLRYAYLWADEHKQGLEEGRKDRPVAVVLALAGAEGATTVAVAPITHSPPAIAEDAIEIPPPVKSMLDLDEERSWIVVTEINVFAWPGPDLRPAGQEDETTPLIGYLPARFFRTVRDRIVTQHKRKKLRRIQRSE